MSEKGYNGRAVIVEFDNEAVIALQNKSLEHSREVVDVTNDDSNGWQTQLPKPGRRGLNGTFEGVATSENYNKLLKLWHTEESDVAAKITHPDGTVIECELSITALSLTAEHSGAVQFSLTCQSNGEVTLTDPTPPVEPDEE